MANTIQLRRSATANAVPTTAQLALGELAINTYDGKLYLKKNVSGTESIIQVATYDSSGNLGIGGSATYKLDVTGQVRIGASVTQSAPSTTDILSTAHVILGGQGGNYLTVGQYTGGAKNYAQWIQSSYQNPTTAVYNLILNPLGGNVGVGTDIPAYKLDVAGDIGVNGNYLVNPNLKSYTEHKVTNSSATGTVTLDLSTSNVFQVTLTGNTTFAFSNPPANTKVFSFTIIVTQDATGGRTITWPTSKKFAGGVTPPPTTAANAVDVWSVMTYDGGTSYIVSLSVKDAK